MVENYPKLLNVLSQPFRLDAIVDGEGVRPLELLQRRTLLFPRNQVAYTLVNVPF